MIIASLTIPASRILDLETNCEILWLKLLTAPRSCLGYFVILQDLLLMF